MLAQKDFNDNLTVLNVDCKIINAPEGKDTVLNVLVPHNKETLDWHPVNILIYE